jgi:hypothetical protein
MAVALAFGTENVEELVQIAKNHAANIKLEYPNENIN